MGWRVLLLLLMAGVSGCSIWRGEPPPVVEPVQPPPVVEAPAPVPPPKPAPVPPEEVAILVSSDIPPYRDVADAVAEQLSARSHTWYLPANKEGAQRVLDEIARSERQQVVAVGLDAAIASKQLTAKKVVFCQVFNYEDYRLTSARMKGVAMLPSFEKSFMAWRALSPDLKKVAIMTGPNLQEQVRAVTAVARQYNITIVHREVASDKELLAAYKEIADSVQGYWLWPDNRVLSTGVLRELLTFSVRSGKQVLVFSKELLAFGGLMSVTSNSGDIANQVVERLRLSEGKRYVPGMAIAPLSEVELLINPVMAKRFGIEIPEQYRKYSHGP